MPGGVAGVGQLYWLPLCRWRFFLLKARSLTWGLAFYIYLTN
jgi:hypothetical protein